MTQAEAHEEVTAVDETYSDPFRNLPGAADGIVVKSDRKEQLELVIIAKTASQVRNQQEIQSTAIINRDAGDLRSCSSICGMLWTAATSKALLKD